MGLVKQTLCLQLAALCLVSSTVGQPLTAQQALKVKCMACMYTMAKNSDCEVKCDDISLYLLH